MHRDSYRTIVPLTILLCSVWAGCEDSPTEAYLPKPFVEAYLIVDRPIDGVVVAMTQSLSVPYVRSSATVHDAAVQISSDSASYTLVYRETAGYGTYRVPDTTVLVKPNTAYTIRVTLHDGTVMTGRTVTPDRIAWVVPPQPVLYYPQDTLRLPSPDSLRIQWTPGNTKEFLIRVRCLDTLGYGQYLQPPTDETNGRTNNLAQFERPESRTYYSTTRWGFVQAESVPTVWTAFRWYGRQSVAVLAPDKNFLNWFKLTQFGSNPQYNPELGSISGGLGVFGSAALVESHVFLFKPQR